MRRFDYLLNKALIEAIDKRQFFDIHAMIVAYQESKVGLRGRSEELENRLKFELEQVLDDHLDQLFCIVAERFIVTRTVSGGDKSNVKYYKEAGISLKTISGMPFIDKSNLSSISQQERFKLLNHLINGPDLSGNFAGSTWKSLASLYIKLASRGKSLDSMILTLDMFYGACHHGGMISDYMDEGPSGNGRMEPDHKLGWIERAIHDRSYMDLKRLAGQASSDIRKIIGGSSFGKGGTDIERLRVALDRSSTAYNYGIQTAADGNNITINKSGRKLAEISIVDNEVILKAKGKPETLISHENYSPRQLADEILSKIVKRPEPTMSKLNIKAERQRIMSMPTDPIPGNDHYSSELDAGLWWHFLTKGCDIPWPEFEDAIATQPHGAAAYAMYVLEKPWPKGEKAIFSMKNTAKYYTEKFPDRQAAN